MAKTPAYIKLDERNHVEKPLLDQLQGLGWEVLDLDNKQHPADSFRESFNEVVMLPVLREQVARINDWMEPDQVEEVVKQLSAGFPGNNLIEKFFPFRFLHHIKNVIMSQDRLTAKLNRGSGNIYKDFFSNIPNLLFIGNTKRRPPDIFIRNLPARTQNGVCEFAKAQGNPIRHSPRNPLYQFS